MLPRAPCDGQLANRSSAANSNEGGWRESSVGWWPDSAVRGRSCEAGRQGLNRVRRNADAPTRRLLARRARVRRQGRREARRASPWNPGRLASSPGGRAFVARGAARLGEPAPGTRAALPLRPEGGRRLRRRSSGWTSGGRLGWRPGGQWPVSRWRRRAVWSVRPPGGEILWAADQRLARCAGCASGNGRAPSARRTVKGRPAGNGRRPSGQRRAGGAYSKAWTSSRSTPLSLHSARTSSMKFCRRWCSFCPAM
jgi:hypothetical protein